MLAKALTCAVVGLDGRLVEVEVDIASYGMPYFGIVGLPDAAVQEAKERVRTAIKNSGLVFPKRRHYLCCRFRLGRERHPGVGRGEGPAVRGAATRAFRAWYNGGVKELPAGEEDSMAVRDKRTEWLRVDMYRHMSPEERILVAARMFEDLVSVVRSSIADSHPDISAEALEREVRRRVLPRGLADPMKARLRQ